MEKPQKPTALSRILDQMPLHLSMEDMENADVAIYDMQQRLASYSFQSMALYLRKFVHGLPSPGFGFELSIDDEDGVYYLYVQGADGIEVDEEHFSNEGDLVRFCNEQDETLQGFAQDINDSPWRKRNELRNLVAALNEVSWRKEDMDDVIAQVMTEEEWDGEAFIAAVHAQEIDQSTSKASAKAKRRPGL